MSFIKNHQVPTGVAYNCQDVFPTNKVYGSYHFICRTENIRISGKKAAVDKCERDIELHPHFIFLPLFGQASRCNNQNALNDATHNQFFQQKSCHNSLAGTSIISQKETYFRLGKQELINSFHLVGKGIDHTTVDGKQRIELIGGMDTLGFSIHYKSLRIAFKVKLSLSC